MLTTIIATVFVLGVLIFIHELGHFILAKWSGIKVEKFSLGFPPSIIKKKWGETEYAIGAIPLGGYVKMAGENPEEETSGAPWEFMSKPVWKRFLVIFAGPFMNFVLAIAILAGLFFFRGKEVNRVYIGEVSENSPAQQAGIKKDDYIVSVDGTKITNFTQMAELIREKVEKPVALTWMHDNKEYTDTVITKKTMAATRSGDSIAIGVIGVGSKAVYQPLGLFASIGEGFDQTIFYVVKTFEFIGGFFSGASKAKDVGGPIFIAQLAGATARAGFDVLLEFMALLSVNLAVLNVLPIPVLDGGHIMFLIAEKFKGSPLSLRVRMIFQQIGIAFILILVILITFNDITR